MHSAEISLLIQFSSVYDIAIWTYAIVIAHYVSELLYYRTSKLSAGIISPLIVGSEWCIRFGTLLAHNAPKATSFVWMIAQYDYYVHS